MGVFLKKWLASSHFQSYRYEGLPYAGPFAQPATQSVPCWPGTAILATGSWKDQHVGFVKTHPQASKAT